MRLLVCGGRGYDNWPFLEEMLDRFHADYGVDVLIEGGASGADRLASRWAKLRGIPVETYLADWDRHGRAAGPLRNKAMLEEGKPDWVLAFPGGRGSRDMVNRAMRRAARFGDVEVLALA